MSDVCVVVQESRGCVVSLTSEAEFISLSTSSSSSTSSDAVNSVSSSSCGSTSHPWRLEAAAGQRINISLLDFTAADDRSRAAGHQRTADLTCRQYGYVLDKSNKRNVSVCGGGVRQSHVYISHSNNVHIVQTQPSDREQNFLIKVEGTSIRSVVLRFYIDFF